jgi:hypothetical protein
MEMPALLSAPLLKRRVVAECSLALKHLLTAAPVMEA